ncbi:acyl-CoA carboxylase epsilon subunit [Leifsonia poae]|uniref:acyl-CoA carboxylase epsilon subunit n=1 Tax=Leifsonia poae TaxID=110933 RepID=UPI003D669425
MSEQPELSAEQIQFVTRGVTPEEIAAVTAVLTAAAAEQQAAAAEQQASEGVDGWSRTQRALREPVHPEAGSWRSFSG